MSATLYKMSEQPWGILVENREGYVMKPEIVKEKWAAMLAFAARVGKPKILIYSPGFRSAMQISDWLDLKDLLLREAPPGLRFAFVIPGWVHTPDSELMVTMMNNYGFPNRIFETKEEAIAWLENPVDEY